MAHSFPAEPGTRCDFCTGLATRKFTITKKIPGNRYKARADSGLRLYACPTHLQRAQRQAGAGVPR